MTNPYLGSKPIIANTIATALRGHLRMRTQGSVILPNIYVGTSPWESDMICVRKSLYWSEFEIKVSVADYRKDFAKREIKWSENSVRKHEAYASGGPIVSDARLGRQRVLPKPKQFYFVVPKGLLDNEDVPSHCGIMEFDEADRSYWKIKATRRAPNLQSPTKLELNAVFNLAMKASYRMGNELSKNP